MGPLDEGVVVDGKYRVERLLGTGGMGAVYLAEHLGLGRRVAVKVLLAPAEQRNAVVRLQAEARAAGSIRHPGIIEVFDIGTTSDGAPYR
jgi:serine/threonine protein kinase